MIEYFQGLTLPGIERAQIFEDSKDSKPDWNPKILDLYGRFECFFSQRTPVYDLNLFIKPWNRDLNLKNMFND